MGYGRNIAIVTLLVAVAMIFLMVSDDSSDESDAFVISGPIAPPTPIEEVEEKDLVEPPAPKAERFESHMAHPAIIPEFIKLPPMGVDEESVPPEEVPPQEMPQILPPPMIVYEEIMIVPVMDYVSMLNLTSLRTFLWEFVPGKDNDSDECDDVETLDVKIAVEEDESIFLPEVYPIAPILPMPVFYAVCISYSPGDAIGPIMYC